MPPAGREHAPGVRYLSVAAMVATGMDCGPPVDKLWPGACPRRTRRGGDGDGLWPPRRAVSSAPTFFALVPASRIVDDILGSYVVFELIADDAVHESRIPKAHLFALDTLVYAPCDCSFE